MLWHPLLALGCCPGDQLRKLANQVRGQALVQYFPRLSAKQALFKVPGTIAKSSSSYYSNSLRGTDRGR